MVKIAYNIAALKYQDCYAQFLAMLLFLISIHNFVFAMLITRMQRYGSYNVDYNHEGHPDHMNSIEGWHCALPVDKAFLHYKFRKEVATCGN